MIIFSYSLSLSLSLSLGSTFFKISRQLPILSKIKYLFFKYIKKYLLYDTCDSRIIKTINGRRSILLKRSRILERLRNDVHYYIDIMYINYFIDV